jgi:hypothetical protein
MNKLLLKVLLVLLAFVFLANLAYLDYSIFFKKEEAAFKPSSVIPESPELSLSEAESEFEASEEAAAAARDFCGPDCQLKISQEVAKAIATISGERLVAEKTVEKIIQPTPAPQTIYLPLGNGDSTTNRDWTDISGSDFILDLADYGSNTEVYWQGNLKAMHANSRCYARIYDQTHYRAVDFSEQSSIKTAYETITSSKLTIWWGENKYRLQIKSLNGITCFLESPRLIIISQ